MTKSRTGYPTSSPPSSSSKLGISGTKSSHLISKLKPKIRIIHVYAPEIIKTDAANFRELVQRLTGKPEDEEEEENKGGRRRKTKTTNPPPKRLLDPLMIMEEQERERMVGLQKNGLRMKKEGEENEDNGKVSSSGGGGGSLEGFSEFDCFMEEFSTMPAV